ncbi:MAG TPA: hypothetical protein VG167_07405 [Verrucomicrobiae bacterium]|nr:hypothetical protein [Verrucomicrobiae bacterium]
MMLDVRHAEGKEQEERCRAMSLTTIFALAPFFGKSHNNECELRESVVMNPPTHNVTTFMLVANSWAVVQRQLNENLQSESGFLTRFGAAVLQCRRALFSKTRLIQAHKPPRRALALQQRF